MHQGEFLFFIFGISTFGFFVLLVGISVANSNRRSRKEAPLIKQRNDELADWAQLKGLTLQPGADHNIGKRYSFLGCLQQGDDQYGYNIMEGIVSNRKVCAFDYDYVTYHSSGGGGGGRHGHYHSSRHTTVVHHKFSAVVVEIGLPLRPLFIRTEKFSDRVTVLAGCEDIDFESEEFNKTFYVKSPDKKWAYDIVSQSIMELLLNYCRFNIEFNGLWVIAYRNETFSAGYFEEALQLLTGIADNLPEHMLIELKGGK